MMLCEEAISAPGSPPGMTASKSSKSSSFHSIHSDDNGILDDTSNFEEIGLDDVDAVTGGGRLAGAATATATATAVVAIRHTVKRPSWSPNDHPPPPAEKLANARPVSLAAGPPARSLSGNFPGTSRPISINTTSANAQQIRPNTRMSLAVVPGAAGNGGGGGISLTGEPRGLVSRSTGSLPTPHRSRSPSPSLSIASTGLSQSSHRRTSWQSNATRRKSIAELERECDDDIADDIPQDLVLDNVPISPRPANERASSRGSSPSPTREKGREKRAERSKTVGNGTPAVAQAQGCLKSPDRKSDGAPFAFKARARSWNAAMADLSAEARALTEKLEEHAGEQEKEELKLSLGRPPNKIRPRTWDATRRSSLDGGGPRIASSSAACLDGLPPALPPIQRSIMIDPLPTSREKEAVLSRTRPAWLPPKDPTEERRHLREYQRMIAHSAEAERRREAARTAQTTTKDSTAGNLMKVWEEEILPRWDDALRERRTRQLWWRGLPPRSRGVVWTRAIGNPLELTETSYQAALGRARQVETRVQGARHDGEDGCRIAWFSAIRKDVSENTWADLRIFQPSGPLHQALVDVLCAYSMYRSDIGYIPGCHTLAALLLLNLPSPAAAFITLANLLNRPMPLAFHSSDAGAKASAYNLVLQMLSRKSTALHHHLTEDLRDVDPDEFLGRVFRSLFTAHLGIDEAARLWDVYVFEGDAVLVRAAVALLLEREMALLGTRSAAEINEVLLKGGAGSRKRAIGETGSEDKFMDTVKNAGR